MVYAILFAGLIIIVGAIISLTTTRRENINFLDKDSTDMMKGMAILCVVLCHYMGTFGQGITVFTPLGGIGVAIFLILSAYGLNESWNQGGGYGWWRKRIIAVVIPYAIVQCFLYWTFHKFNLGKFLLDIFCIKPLYMNGWYLSYLVLWYILFYIINKITFFKQRKVRIFFSLSIILFIIYSIVLKDSLRAEQSFSFFVGIILSEKKKMLSDNDTKKIFLNLKTMTVFLVVGIAFLGLKQIPSIHENTTFVFDIVQLLIKLPTGLGIMELTWFLSKKINMKIFLYIGLFGFELYIIHGYILEKVPLTLNGAIAFMIIAFDSAIIYHLFVKKISRYMKRVILKRNI